MILSDWTRQTLNTVRKLTKSLVQDLESIGNHILEPYGIQTLNLQANSMRNFSKGANLVNDFMFEQLIRIVLSRKDLCGFEVIELEEYYSLQKRVNDSKQLRIDPAVFDKWYRDEIMIYDTVTGGLKSCWTSRFVPKNPQDEDPMKRFRNHEQLYV